MIRKPVLAALLLALSLPAAAVGAIARNAGRDHNGLRSPRGAARRPAERQDRLCRLFRPDLSGRAARSAVQGDDRQPDRAIWQADRGREGGIDRWPLGVAVAAVRKGRCGGAARRRRGGRCARDRPAPHRFRDGGRQFRPRSPPKSPRCRARPAFWSPSSTAPRSARLPRPMPTANSQSARPSNSTSSTNWRRRWRRRSAAGPTSCRCRTSVFRRWAPRTGRRTRR